MGVIEQTVAALHVHGLLALVEEIARD